MHRSNWNVVLLACRVEFALHLTNTNALVIHLGKIIFLKIVHYTVVVQLRGNSSLISMSVILI